MEVVMTTGATRHAKLQSNCYHQQTNTQFLQAGCPSCCPTNSVRALKDKVSHSIHGCDHPKLTWGLPTLSLTIKGSSYYGKCCQASCQPCDASTPALCQCGLSYWLFFNYSYFYFSVSLYSYSLMDWDRTSVNGFCSTSKTKMVNSTNINSLAESVIIEVSSQQLSLDSSCLFSFMNTRCSMLTHSRLRLPADSSPDKRADDNALRTCDLLLSYVWSIRHFSLVLPGTSYFGSNLCNTGLPKQRLGYIEDVEWKQAQAEN